MANKILVEIIPALNQNTSSEDCCESKESECCNSIDVNLEEVQNIKKEITNNFNNEVSVYVYDYNISLDRVLATKKLTTSVRDKGYSFIQSDRIIETVTPAVYVNDCLVSFLKSPNIEEIIDSIKTEMKQNEFDLEVLQ
ncbi:hypothetical protein CHN50_20745 [Priestia aryabhattai]|uniref:ArsD-related vicinal cysteine protein VcpD n=1 Tax=Bacillaceae TaxID=186817 RepID=UPI000BA09525|nr:MULTISPECIES: hypothetical protein [Bacillaceae]OZT10691.1 hypothetical protein CHN50_20745 [Priestia aryabhattai]MCA1204152.1 hypothetical protein [Priestia flexa]MCG7315464.1 hypothetical protein [Priestia flexa]QCS54124.1 hypothetical protein FED53_16745 [Priestia flexa]WHX79807.1 hypothetical protein QNH32_04160 [Priestia flexa]